MVPDRPKHARVYIRQDGHQAIIAIVHFNQDGMLWEAPGPLVLTSWDPDILGDTVQTALIQSTTVPFDLRSRKVTGSPVLQASGEPSARAFESRFLQIDVSGEDKRNAVYKIEGRPLGEFELTLSARLNGTESSAELGRLLTRIAEACRGRRL